ncbi:relA-associated inhibitor isoform X2 [Stegostoma tigrinum]|nr:relA-associated inhibitor isoform X2 [Stegostoma tigrinum]
MTDEQFDVGPPPLSNIYQTLSECQTGLMLQSAQKKLNEATHKLDKLSQELDSMWSTQSSPVVTDAAQSDSKTYQKESPVTTSTSSNMYGPSWAESQSKCDELLPVVSETPSSSPQPLPAYTPLVSPQQPPTPYTFNPVFDRAPSPRPMVPGSPMLHQQEPRAPFDRAPSPRPMVSGSPILHQQEPRAPFDRAPSPRGMVSGSPMLHQQEPRAPFDRAPSPRPMVSGSPMLHQQEPRAPFDRAPSPRGMVSGSPMLHQQEPRAPFDRAPSPRPMVPGSPMLHQQEPRAPFDRTPSPRPMVSGSPMLHQQEPRAPFDRAPSPRPMVPGSPMLHQQEPRALFDRAPSPRLGFSPVTQWKNPEPSAHPLVSVAHEPQSSPGGIVECPLPQQPGLFNPVPSAYPGPLGNTRVSPRENVPPLLLSAASRHAPDRYEMLLEGPDGRGMSGFALNPGAFNVGTGDTLKKKKPGVWAEADLDIAYEKKPSQTPSNETKREQNWSTMKHGGSWRQTDLDLAVLPNKALARQSKAFNSIQIYGTLPKGTVPPQWRHETAHQQRRSPQHSPWPNLPSPIVSRTSVPPSGSRPSSIKERRNVLPLSVLIRPTIVSRGQGRIAAGARLPQDHFAAPPMMRYPQFQPITEGGRKMPDFSALPSNSRHSPLPLPEMGEVETEIANILQPGDSPDAENIPRPLSPTRLQPVSLPDSEAIQDMEELMRIRAAIPRPLKRRTSIEQPVQWLVPMQKQAHLYQQLTKLFTRSGAGQRKQQDPAEGSALSSSPQISPASESNVAPGLPAPILEFPTTPSTSPVKHSILKQGDSSGPSKTTRARLNPLVVLLDAALLGELEVVKRVVYEMDDPSQSNDEGITGLHNAVCGGHYDIVEFLVNCGVNINAADGYGWTPLHCAASCNDLAICTFLVKKGAAIFLTTLSDGDTAAEKCDRYLDGYEECARFLFSAEQQAGMMNSAVVYALWDYEAENSDELSFREGEAITILQRGDKEEKNWWWASLYGREGYVPYNLLGLFPRVRPAV